MSFKLGSSFSTLSILRWLWGAWRGNRLQAMLNAFIGLLNVGVSLGSVWAVKHAIDVASGSVHGSVYRAVGVMALLILADFGINIAGIWVKNLLGIRAQNRMQQRLLNRILRSQWQGRPTMHSGDVLNRLEGDVGTVVGFLTETLPGTLSTLALFVGAFVCLYVMDHRLALIIVAMIPVFVGLSRLYVGRMRRLTRDVRSSDSEVQSVLQETIQHNMLIKTFEGVSAMVGKLENTQSRLRRKVVSRTRFSVFSRLVLNFGFALGYLVAFLWTALRLSHGTLSFGGMTAFLQLVNKIQSPARSLTRLAPSFVTVFTAAERLMEIEANPLEEQGDSVCVPAPCGIRLRNVSYRYDKDEDPVISHLTFNFAPGTSTAVLGPTGAGKTTLVRLLLALVSPNEGCIDIYNDEVCHKVSPLTRCNLVYVPQGNTLMSGTIRDNLRLGRPGATDEEMWRALDTSCAGFVRTLPRALDTPCAEEGGGLSEGQAQRIAIARALLRPGGVLIFDESTSALDEQTERLLLNNLLNHCHKTVIFVTHRPAVTAFCTQTLHIGKTAKD